MSLNFASLFISLSWFLTLILTLFFMYYATSASKSFVKAFSHTHNSHFIQSFFIRKRGWFSKALKLLLCLQLSRVLRSWLKFCRVGVHFQSRPISSSWTLWLKIPQKRKWLALIYHVLFSFLYCFQAFILFFANRTLQFCVESWRKLSLPGVIIIKICN